MHLHLIRAFLVLFFASFFEVSLLHSFTYVTAGERFSPDTVVHPIGYIGKGGVLEITVGLHPDYAYLEKDIAFAANQTVAIWNNLIASTGNLQASVEIPAKGGTDVWGVMIHELGHTLGLAHPNHGGARTRNAAKSTNGKNGKPDLQSGKDGVVGSSDDLRGDDVSLNYFKIEDNNPFVLSCGCIVDSTTYSRDVKKLPSGDNFPEIANRQVAMDFHNLKNTMGIMVGGGSLIPGAVRRSIAADDVAGIRYAMSGLDEIQGTSDDYSIRLKYIGTDAKADVVIKFDKPDGNASAGITTVSIRGSSHKAMRTGRPIRYNPNLANGRTWYFPVAESIPVEVTGETVDGVNLRIATVKGKRYGITCRPNSGTEDSICTDLVVRVNGKQIAWTGAEYFFFVAKGRETNIEMNFPKNLSGDTQFAACELTGKPLVIQ